ncbi:hypothetical protein VKS41_001125 [Umbelopsis sp. WA50703]
MSQDTSEATNSSLTAAQQFLDSIDADVSLSSTDGTTEASAQPSKPADAKEIMSFIDEWTTTPVTAETDVSEKTEHVDQQAKTSSVQQTAQSDSGAGWASWGNSLWSQASAAVKAGTDQINKVTQDSETARLFEGRVKDIQSLVNKENIGKLGSELRNLTLTGVSTFLDTVAPPLSDEEIVEVWLNKGQLGYLGLEQITYRAWASVLEQTATGDIVVQTDDKESSNSGQSSGGAFTIGLHKGLAEAKAVAKAEVQALAEKHPSTQSTDAAAASTSQEEEPQNEIRICPVYLSVQATSLDLVEDQSNQMAFSLLLSDPRHKLEFQGLSQSIPKRWLEIPYDENEWVEEKLVKILRLSLTTIAQEYVWTRMNHTES